MALVYYVSLLMMLSKGLSLIGSHSSIQSKQRIKLFAARTLDSEWAEKRLDKFHSSTRVSPISVEDEESLLQVTDVSRLDNFYVGAYDKVRRMRNEAKSTSNMEKLLETDKKYFNLMNSGFQRRRFIEASGGDSDEAGSAIERATQKTKDYFEIGRSKEEQLEELKQKALKERSGLWRLLLPQPTHKYIDYIRSLIVKPNKGEIIRNMLITGFFSFVVFSNATPRTSCMYLVIGKLIVTSVMLSRNMPKPQTPAGMQPQGRKKIANWSSNAFRTAIAITLMTSLLSSSLYMFVSGLVPLKLSLANRIKGAMIASLLSCGYFTSFFEVFEEKDKNGWRWKKAIDTLLPEDEKEKLRDAIFGEKTGTDRFDYEYNPEIDDYPPLPKYIDEDVPIPGDEIEAIAAFNKFSEERKQARRPPLVEAPPDSAGFGGKGDLYPESVPKWLKNAYKKNVLARNKWSTQPQKFDRTVEIEFKPVDGPLGFRDKKPDWLKTLFGKNIWEDRLGVSRAAARAFGTYRKTMWKIDDKVVLQPADV